MTVDARLARGSGVAAVERILAAGFIPHLFVSGNVAAVRIQRPDAVLLEKPFREPELARAISQAMGRSPIL